MQLSQARIERIVQTCIVRIQVLEQKVVLLEHSANQQSILVDTLGSIMEELERQER